MNKIKRAIVSVGLALSILGGGALIAAPSANAYSYTQGPEKWQFDRSGSYCGVWAYIDYNWWEEVFQGQRDGWKRLYWALC